MTSSSSSSPSTAVIRTWRTAFLTLRDETLTSSPKSEPSSSSSSSKKVGAELLQSLLFSQHQSLVSAAPSLPSHEVTSDLLFLIELAVSSAQHGQDSLLIFTNVSHLIHDVCKHQRVTPQLNSSSWIRFLDSFGAMLRYFLGNGSSSNAPFVRPAMECMETLRYLVSVYNTKLSGLDNIQLFKFLVGIVEYCPLNLVNSFYNGTTKTKSPIIHGRRIPKYSNLLEVHTLAFTMLGEAFERVGSSFPTNLWQSAIEVVRKLMDAMASKSFLVEEYDMSRFYASLLNCLHLILTDPKGSLLDHVPGFVATLRMFLSYGLASRPQFAHSRSSHKESESKVTGCKLNAEEPKLNGEEPVKKDRAPYRPPHLRKRENNMQDSGSFSDHDSSTPDFTSSDSECSDSDGLAKESDRIESSKVRVAAIVCLQDLCQADPKSFTTQWTMLLPTNDVLQPRKFESNLMTCLLFDPHLKARIASASTLATMLDGPSPMFLQVAEYRESTKWGSFMSLSSSLGQILMQLHAGVLYLIQRETHSRLLASVFKILTLLISSTPYSRMPKELLPTVIRSLLTRIENGFSWRNDQTGLLASTINCLAAALSTSPSSPHVKEMLLEEISTGVVGSSGLLSALLQYSEQVTNPSICLEAFQAVRAVTHNYPCIAFACWEQVSNIVIKTLRIAAPEVPMRMWKGQVADPVVLVGEKVLTASIKVLDECLRAISGFKGTEDPQDDKILDSPFTSDCMRTKKVSSAPSYVPEISEDDEDEQKASIGSEHWSKTIEDHMPLILYHTSAMIRAASLTCFAGISSSVFVSLVKEKQEFIVSSLVRAAVRDEVPSVRSASCRAIGVISYFPDISQSAEILNKFIHAVEINTRHSLVSVRITAAWAFANICDSLRHCFQDFTRKKSTDFKSTNEALEYLVECALHLTKDGDKIKSNAVRALGYLSRLVKYPVNSVDLSARKIEVLSEGSSQESASKSDHLTYLRDSHLLERMVQAFLSCVTTGNVKVQWNVCHAISMLFLNEAVQLQHMDWGSSIFSVLLLLLRDSSNFKIRIQAAAALAVPSTVLDYGKSFSDVVQGLEHTLENLGSDQISEPSSFKYRIALEKQITSTMLHVLTLASSTGHQPLKDFLVKKATFLEKWFKALCSSIQETSSQVEPGNSTEILKKVMISRAIKSLIQVYEGRNYHVVAERFKKLDDAL